jgi:NAD(P)H-hydrate epimerase
MRAIPFAALASAAQAQALDAQAACWGLNSFALVEAAGRTCAEVFVRAFPRFFEQRVLSKMVLPKIAVLAGNGNNAADALVMFRALVLRGYADPDRSFVLVSRFPAPDAQTPLSGALVSVQKLNVPVWDWDSDKAAALAVALAAADIIIDGIAGTGLQGPLHGSACEMLDTANALRAATGDLSAPSPFVVAIDVPSGAFDGWQPDMPLMTADATLAIEPQKLSLYAPPVRPSAGTILAVGGIFPPALVEQYQDAELVTWESAAARVPAVPNDAYKYKRGLVEIRAGSPGAAGAAKLAALGAQAAGAGMVRLIADPSLYPVLGPGACGIMVVPDGLSAEEKRFRPAAALLGPGWGRGADRARLLETYLPLEQQGLPLILDADAIALAKDIVFHGNAILTPHPGEFSAYTGLSSEAILADPIPALKRFAFEKNAHILLKGHVLYIASPDGRIGIVDGMNPVLATGGSGDVLAGFCAAIAARQTQARDSGFDAYICACAAASLLIQAAASEKIAGRFVDPAEFAAAAAAIAGRAWLSGKEK